MNLVWTKEALSWVAPRTREDITPPKKGPKREELWAHIHSENADVVRRLGAGIPSATPEMASLMTRAGELIALPDPPATFDADVTAAVLLLLEPKAIGNDLLALVNLAAGLARTLEVFLRAQQLSCVGASRESLGTLVETPEPLRYRGNNVLRSGLILADDAEYAACLQIARNAWKTATIGTKTSLAYFFLRELEWTREVAKAWLAEPPGKTPLPAFYIFPNLEDIELATQLFDKRAAWPQILNIVARHGEKALPLVLRGFTQQSKDDLKYAAIAASLFESDEVATMLASALGQSKVRPHASAYFYKHPALARKALTPLAAGKTRVAAFAQEILAQLDRAESKTSASRGEEATLAELPEILRDPPWCRKKRAKRAVVVLPNIAMLPREETFDPDGNERVPLHFKNMIPNFPSGEGFASAILSKLPEWYCAPQMILGTHSPKIALALARVVNNRQYGDTALKWMMDNLDLAIVGLIPAAVGEEGAPRNLAERILRRLAASGKTAEIERVATEYGAEVRKSVGELLSWDAHLDCPKSPPKLPPVCKLDAYTTPKLANGKLLPAEAVTHIAEMLSFTLLDPPYVGVEEVRAACEPRSLAEFAWDMARAWELAGAKKTGEFMIYSLAHFADDEVTRRTTPAIKDRRILEVLRHIGTHAAVMELATIAARARVAPSPYFNQGNGPEAMLREIAQERGITKEELDDLLAPTTELNGLTLDFGDRTFKVTFDSKLEPIAVDAENKRSPQFPAKRKTDDAAKVKLAQVKWNEIREDVMAIGLRRIASLEHAMVQRRTWDAARFREVWIAAPFMHYLAEAVVWTTNDGRTFRVAEDLTFSDEHDEAFVLPATARIGVAHPVRIGRESVARWKKIFEDYNLIQAFAQLTRESPDLEPKAEERDASTIERTLSEPPSPYSFATLLAERGFKIEHVDRRTLYRRPISLRSRESEDALVEISHSGQVKIDALTIRFLQGKTAVAVKDVDPVDVFEALRDAANIS